MAFNGYWQWSVLERILAAAPWIVGLILVIVHRHRGRWRVAAILGFSIAIVSEVFSLILGLVIYPYMWRTVNVWMSTLITGVAQLVWLAGSVGIVAAVLLDRTGESPAQPAQPAPPQA